MDIQAQAGILYQPIVSLVDGKIFGYEALSRITDEKFLQNATMMAPRKKFFLNVEPNAVHDEYKLNPSNVIFEVALKAIDHYKKQNFPIAIDDVGAVFLGLNIIASIKPNYIKIDMNLIKDIDDDEIKQLLCKAMVDFGKNHDIKLIAKGIETEEELKTLVKLKVDYGQGYYLGIPQETFEDRLA